MTVSVGTSEFATVIRRWRTATFGAAPDRGPFSPSTWARVGELGVLALCTPEGGGSATDLVDAMEELGRAALCGPLVPTVVSAQLLDHTSNKDVLAGQDVVAVDFGHAVVPWASIATTFVQVDGATAEAWLCEPTAPPRPVRSMSGEPWAVVALRRTEPLGDATRGISLGWLAQASYLIGAARRVIDEAAAYARDRSQFGRPIGAFQAVSHPLADSWSRLEAARCLVHSVAGDETVSPTRAARAQLATGRHSVEAAYRAYQTFGGMGFASENTIAAIGVRIREVALLGPAAKDVQRHALAGLDR